LMFGDGAWVERRSAAQEARLDAWLERARRPLVVELGAGTHIPSVRAFGLQLVRALGARMLRINPREPAPPTPADVGLAMTALQGLQAIAAAMGDGRA
jgi:hypothetical protein